MQSSPGAFILILIPEVIQFQPHHSELQYDDDLHRYTLKSGEVLSSVTSILKAEGIQTYYQRDDDGSYRQIGKWVHQAIAWFEHGTLDESQLSEGIAKYLASYRQFRDTTGFRPLLPLIEVPMWSPTWRFCGTPDLPGRIDNRFLLVDLKTGSKRSGDKVQIAGYGDLLMNSVVGFENIYPEGVVVYLDSEGSRAKAEPVSAEEMHNNLITFYAALRVNRWKRSNNQTNE